MSHTPGPWKTAPCSHGGRIVIRGDGVHGSHPQTHVQIVPEDDARLIAAAPDLLAALEMMFQILNVHGMTPENDPDGIAKDQWDLYCDNARAAIRKAEGA